MTGAPDATIPGIAVVIDDEAVPVTSERQLAVLSSAVVGGGLCSARDIVNMHVDKDYDGGSPQDDLAAFAVSCGVDGAFVGLSNTSNAGITATAAKTMALAEWDVHTPQGDPASGASTDSVVVACTLRGAGLSYAGPATTVAWLVARTVRAAITRMCREKVERDGGRRVGW